MPTMLQIIALPAWGWLHWMGMIKKEADRWRLIHAAKKERKKMMYRLCVVRVRVSVRVSVCCVWVCVVCECVSVGIVLVWEYVPVCLSLWYICVYLWLCVCECESECECVCACACVFYVRVRMCLSLWYVCMCTVTAVVGVLCMWVCGYHTKNVMEAKLWSIQRLAQYLGLRVPSFSFFAIDFSVSVRYTEY